MKPDDFWHSGLVESATIQKTSPGTAADWDGRNCIQLGNASFLLDIIELSLHEKKSEWIFLRELRVGTGRSRQSLQRLDAFALNCLPQPGMKRVCYELKTSRSDFICEMKNPLKRRIGMHLSNEFFFVTPAGMLTSDEVPTDCGLIEIGRADNEESRRLIRSHPHFLRVDAQTGWYCIVSISAPWRDTPAPTWQFVAAMLRNQQRSMTDRSSPPAKQLRIR